MTELEKYINNSWERIPQRFKDRIKNLEFTLEEDDPSRKANVFATFSGTPQGRDWPCKIVFYSKPIEKLFQRSIDKIMIHELAHYFGFDEKKAYELMEKKL